MLSASELFFCSLLSLACCFDCSSNASALSRGFCYVCSGAFSTVSPFVLRACVTTFSFCCSTLVVTSFPSSLNTGFCTCSRSAIYSTRSFSVRYYPEYELLAALIRIGLYGSSFRFCLTKLCSCSPGENRANCASNMACSAIF